jgi:hypothetical protein
VTLTPTSSVFGTDTFACLAAKVGRRRELNGPLAAVTGDRVFITDLMNHCVFGGWMACLCVLPFGSKEPGNGTKLGHYS